MLKFAAIRVLVAFLCALSLAGYAYGETPDNVDIPAGDLSVALRALAKQTGAEFVYSENQVLGIRTAGARGHFTVAGAAKKLLEGTTLELTIHQSGALLIAPARGGVLIPTSLLDAQPPAVERQSDSVTPPANSPKSQLQEVVVTATRHEEALTKVPMSVQAFTQEEMEQTGVKQFEDMVRLTPGLTLNNTFAGGTNIAIRGIGSDAGSATTGIYIDDVPIQVRNLGYSATSLFPKVFDLERVEVLRGPQGTLFGAGSEGGTVRFIQPEPSLDKFSSYMRGEVSDTSGGAPSYEAGVAVGGPIIQDTLGFRFSLYYRHDGGWIDRVTATNYQILDPTGSAYGASASLDVTGTPYPNSNYQDATAARLAFKIAPTSNLTITPSFFYQSAYLHDSVQSFWLATSDPSKDRFATPLFAQIPGVLSPTGLPDLNRGTSELYLPSLELQWHPGNVAVYSTTAYLATHKVQTVDSTIAYLQAYNAIVYPSPGQYTPDHNIDKIHVFSQEFRVQSDDTTKRLTWLAGAFYSHSNQYSEEDIHPNFFDTICCYFGIPDLTNGPPFGPGSTNFQNIWGSPMLANSESYYASFTSIDEQLAGFGEISYKILDPLTLTVGVRVSRVKFNFNAYFNGPENNLNAPFGSDCPAGATCVFNQPGPFAPAFPVGNASTTETATTPKFTIAYQANDSNLFYATASKGFRPGGGEVALPAVCDQDLINAGYVGPNGEAQTPLSFKNDSVWNYEVGSKNQLLDHRLLLDVNAYYIKWHDVQANLSLPICGYSFTDNFGNATSKGVDLAVQMRPLEHLNLGIDVSYNKATFDQDVGVPGAIVFVQGESLPQAGAPWNVAVTADYQGHILSRAVYAHADFTHTSEFRPTNNQVPGTVNYQPLVPPNEKYEQVNLRMGTYVGSVDVSVFVNNLFDKTPYIGLSQPQDPYGVGASSQWTANTIRPRTVGLTLSTRF